MYTVTDLASVSSMCIGYVIAHTTQAYKSSHVYSLTVSRVMYRVSKLCIGAVSARDVSLFVYRVLRCI